MRKLISILLILGTILSYGSIIFVDIYSDNSCPYTKEIIILEEPISYTFEELQEKLIEDIEKEEERKAEEERQRLLALYNANYNNAWVVARSLVGRGGDCWSICKLFIQLFSGKNINNRYIVSEPIPGDIIYYSNGGLGVQHWAIYLGDGLALHGNYNGIAQIKIIYLTGASYPVYYRVR